MWFWKFWIYIFCIFWDVEVRTSIISKSTAFYRKKEAIAIENKDFSEFVLWYYSDFFEHPGKDNVLVISVFVCTKQGLRQDSESAKVLGFLKHSWRHLEAYINYFTLFKAYWKYKPNLLEAFSMSTSSPCQAYLIPTSSLLEILTYLKPTCTCSLLRA